MRLVHVVPHVSEEASGPSYSVPRLCESLAALGYDVELSCLAARDEVPGVRLDVHAQWPIFRRFAISHTHPLSLYHKSLDADIIHNHSLWSMVNVASGWVVPGRRAKLVSSPRGTLSAWALSRSKELKILLWPLQRRVLERADLIHATSEVEYEEIRARGLRSPVAIVPNGIDVPLVEVKREGGEQRTLLYLGRIHPIKGLDRLLLAWQALEREHSTWRLVIAGPGEPSHTQKVKEMARNLGLGRVEFPGPVYGEEKSKLYWSSDLFVLPSHSENFGMVVAEALSHGCPAVVSRRAPWQGLVDRSCGFWVDNGVGELSEALDGAMALDGETLAKMGKRGRAWMKKEFGWERVAMRMSEVYRWLMGEGERPETVREG